MQLENDRLRAQIEEMHNLGERDAQDSGKAKYLTVHDKGKKPIVHDDVDIPVDHATRQTPPRQKATGLDRARDTRIALHLATPIMAYFAKQGEKQTEGRASQTYCPKTRMHYLRAWCRSCRQYIPPSVQHQRPTCRMGSIHLATTMLSALEKEH